MQVIAQEHDLSAIFTLHPQERRHVTQAAAAVNKRLPGLPQANQALSLPVPFRPKTGNLKIPDIIAHDRWPQLRRCQIEADIIEG